MMSMMLGLAGIQVSVDPSAIFEWMTRETPGYTGLNYISIGALGAQITQEAEAV